MRVARRALRLELAVLDSPDAVANPVTPIHPHPERSTDGPWLGLRDDHAPHHSTHPPRAQHRRPLARPRRQLPDDNYLDDNYLDDNYPRSALTDHNVACHLVHDNHDPNPGRSTDGTWPDNPINRSATHQGGSHDETQEDQEPYSTNRGRWGDVDVVNGRI